MRGEFYNYPAAASFGKGGRASGGWVFDETLIRRVRLSDFFAPFVAKCLSFSLFPFLSISYFPIYYYILFILDITYLYLIKAFNHFVNLLSCNSITEECLFNLPSYGINKGSSVIAPEGSFTEFFNEKGVLQLYPISL